MWKWLNYDEWIFAMSLKYFEFKDFSKGKKFIDKHVKIQITVQKNVHKELQCLWDPSNSINNTQQVPREAKKI